VLDVQKKFNSYLDVLQNSNPKVPDDGEHFQKLQPSVNSKEIKLTPQHSKALPGTFVPPNSDRQNSAL
jgi:hypothetical protein